jgi:hypothetical protein
VEPGRTSRQLAAGCLYESDRWPNACHAITVYFDEHGRPERYALRFRTWSPRGHWFDDGGVYREESGRPLWQSTSSSATRRTTSREDCCVWSWIRKQGGALNRVLSAAEEKLRLERERKSEYGAALASGLRADILAARVPST